MDTARSLGAHALREIAVASHTDPRTVARVLRGLPVRGDARDRIVAALAGRGIVAPATREAPPHAA